MLSSPCVEEYAASCTLSPSVLTWLRRSGPSTPGFASQGQFSKSLEKRSQYILKIRELPSSLFEVGILTYFRILCGGVLCFLTGSLVLQLRLMWNLLSRPGQPEPHSPAHRPKLPGLADILPCRTSLCSLYFRSMHLYHISALFFTEIESFSSWTCLPCLPFLTFRHWKMLCSLLLSTLFSLSQNRQFQDVDELDVGCVWVFFFFSVTLRTIF